MPTNSPEGVRITLIQYLSNNTSFVLRLAGFASLPVSLAVILPDIYPDRFSGILRDKVSGNLLT